MIAGISSRREFLKNFAMLSVGVMMLTVTAVGCSETYDEELPSVIGIYFYDADLQRVELQGNQNVPVHTQFELVFSTDMKTELSSYETAITLLDSNSNPVAFTASWVDARTLTVTPSADLSLNTDYILTVEDLRDSAGNPLNLYASASAEFRTTSM